MPLLAQRPEYFANKFKLKYDPISYQCTEEWYETRVSIGPKIPVNLDYYCNFLKPFSTKANCGNRPMRKEPQF